MASPAAPVDVPLRWIDDVPPADLPLGATLGAPLPRGRVASYDALAVLDAEGAPVPAQFWPLVTLMDIACYAFT